MKIFSRIKKLSLSVRRWVRAHQVLPMALCMFLSLLTLPPLTLCLTILILFLSLLLCL